jgi:hypothetical protein
MKRALLQLHGNSKEVHSHETFLGAWTNSLNGVAVRAHVIPLWVTRVDLSHSVTGGREGEAFPL